MSVNKEDTEEKLNWMYQGPAGHVSREEYLLGRKVDASLDILNRQEAGEDPQEAKPAAAIEHEIAPLRYTARRPEDDDPSAPVVQVDMRRKLMEDPLLEIRKKEQRTKAEVTSNPVKMSQLRLLIESIQGSDKKKKKKSKKSKKKSSKKSKKSKKRRRDSSSSSSSDSESEEDRRKKPKKAKHDDSHSSRRNDEGSSRVKQRESDSYPDHRSREHERQTRKYDYRDTKSSDHKSNSREDRHNDSDRHRNTVSDRHRNTVSAKAPEFQRDRTTSSKMSEDEKERRRQQMMQMAQDRDVQRKDNVERYHRERLAEEQEENTQSRKMLQKYVNSSDVSIEDRIKSRKSTYQRGSDAMSKNFVRK